MPEPALDGRAMVGVVVAGWDSDRLLRSGISGTWARKLPVMTGLCLAPIIVAANFTDSVPPVIFFMSAAFFAQGFMQLGWAALSDIAPVRPMGLAGDTFSFAAKLGGTLAPIVIGVIIDSTGSMAGGLVYVAAPSVGGFLAYAFLIDQVERLDA
ncbi:hypothetical protein [Streptomyces sp. NPDC058249]|uniref:hypothetical protein n=1 Tax=Streptomyces sp. NPDC058249 TaxID=3346403 RepID=UPI0036E0EB14